MSNKYIDALSPNEVLGLTIYGESRGEPIEGQVAVANVIKNRMFVSPGKYKTINSVCLEPLQFSCWNESDPNYKILDEIAQKLLMGGTVDIYLQQSMYVANGVLKGLIFDNTNRAEYYLTSKLFFGPNKPAWAKKFVNMKEIGNQVFFNV